MIWPASQGRERLRELREELFGFPLGCVCVPSGKRVRGSDTKEMGESDRGGNGEGIEMVLGGIHAGILGFNK